MTTLSGRGLQLMMAVACVFGSATFANAQGSAAVPVRITRVTASSRDATLRSAASVHELANGAVLVNDVGLRQLVVVSADLATSVRIADTTTTLSYTYGLKAKPTGLVSWTADSALFFDSDRLAVLVIDRAGVVTGVVAPVRVGDIASIANGTLGAAVADGRGRLLYAVPMPFDPYKRLPAIGGPAAVVAQPDSNPIVRADFGARTVDTVAMLRAPVQKVVITRRSNGGVESQIAVNPLPLADDWTVLPDGTIAIVRASDYHIDWIAPDGSRTSSAPMPFDWRRISPEEKRAIVDSTRRVLQSAQASAATANAGSGGAAETPMSVTIESSDIPDVYPSVRVRQTRADLDGYVWILPNTTSSTSAGLLYDVVDRSGRIIERVSLPSGRALVGFGRGSVLYLGSTQGAKFVLERAVIVR